jgi:phosphoribosylamine-glycine ligase
MSKRPVAIVLGGTNPHIALIKNLQKRGYYVVLIDYFENPPAAEFADEHIRESTLDEAAVLEIARKANAKLVISTCIDQANMTACYVAEKLGLPKPYSHATSLKVTDKGIMKQMMLEGGIPTSKYITVDRVDDPRISSLKFPLVVKPSDCTGSKGVRKATTSQELREYLTSALQVSRSNNAIVEEFEEGMEVQADFFVKNAEAFLIMIREKAKVAGGKGVILQSFGSIIPIQVSEKARANMLKVANQIVQVFKLENTSLFFQAIVNGDEVNIVEFAARVGGGLSYRMIQVMAGFDILDATIDTYLGNPVTVNYRHPESCYSTVIIYSKPGIFDSVIGYQELLEKKCIEEFFLFKTPGMEIGEELTSSNRVGAFLTKANTKQELLKKIYIAINKLEILNAEGNALMRKDIYNNVMV